MSADRAESQPITLIAIVKRLKTVTVNDKMQRGYRYTLTAPMGRNFDSEFRPDLTPKEMLALGVFCGKYMTDCREEFPASWFAHARCSPSGRDCSLNYFGVDASQPLSLLRGRLTEKSLIKIGETSQTRRFASERGEFSPNGS